MFFRKANRFFTLAISAFLVAGIVPIFAQEPKPETPQPPASTSAAVSKRTVDPNRRVPDYFGQIGLTPEQKEAIYKIRAKHAEKIDALKKQIAEAQAAMLAECESQLTDSQKKQLEFRRANGRAKKAQGTQVGSEPKAADKGL